MNGCSLRRVISSPWARPDQQRHGERHDGCRATASGRQAALSPCDESLAMMHAGEADHRADRQVDAAGDDHERDADREDAEHRDLARGVDDVRLPRGSRGSRWPERRCTSAPAPRTCRARVSCGAVPCSSRRAPVISARHALGGQLARAGRMPAMRRSCMTTTRSLMPMHLFHLGAHHQDGDAPASASPAMWR